MKKRLFIFASTIACVIGFFMFFEKSPNTTIVEPKASFDPDLCQNGYAGSWTGACICFDGYHGKYCKKKTSSPRERERERESNSSLKSTSYSTQNQSFQIILSDEILSHSEAVQFCKSLGDKWTLAYRKDFNCSQTGINCLDINLFSHIKKQYGHRGFFWLEETSDNQNAYYADLNDGTVYHMNKLNNKTAQALCFFER